MLAQALGSLISYITVVLLLSLMVTGLVQFSQAALRLRSRNLQQGIASLLATLASEFGGDVFNKRKYLGAAAQILNEPNVAVVQRVRKPDSTVRRALGPKVSWVEPKTLSKAIRRFVARPQEDLKIPPIPPELISKLGDEIQRMGPALSKRFQLIIRWYTVVWSLIVATAFQVNTPELLTSLFTNHDAQTPPRETRAPGSVEPTAHEEPYDLVAQRALTALTEKFPGHEEQLAQAGTEGLTCEDLIGEVRTVLGPAQDTSAVADAYAALLKCRHKRQADASVSFPTISQDPQADPAHLGIGFWREGKDYYYDSLEREFEWSNILGVLMTGILMSFGAPFWFQNLQKLAGLRDRLSPPDEKRRDDQDKGRP